MSNRRLAVKNFWLRSRIVIYGVFCVIPAFYIYSALSGGRLGLLNDLNEFLPERLTSALYAEPWMKLTAEYVGFGILCLFFWHSLLLMLIPELFGIPIGRLKRFFKSIDYIWYSLSIAAIIVAIHALMLDRYSTLIDRRESVAAVLFSVDLDNFQETRNSCDSNMFVSDYNFSARNKIVSFGAAEICEIVASTQRPSLLIFDNEFRGSCNRIDFQYTGANYGTLPYDKDSLPVDIAEHFALVLGLCVEVDYAVLQRRQSRDLRASAESFEALGLSPSSNWFIILILIAALKMTKTTFDVRYG